MFLLFCGSAAKNHTNIKKLFLEAEPGDFPCTAYPSCMLFLTIFGEVMFQLIIIIIIIITLFQEGDIYITIVNHDGPQNKKNKKIYIYIYIYYAKKLH